MKNIFVTFGDGTKGWIDARKRIVREAKKAELFETHIGLDDKWLKEWAPDAFKIMRDFSIQNNRRGHGYWIWKPALLLWADKLFPKHQILYVDAGSSFNIESETARYTLNNWLELSYKNGGQAWQLSANKEKYWTKRELVDYLSPPQRHLESGQIQSGYIALPPSKSRRKLLESWYQVASLHGGILLSDTLFLEQISGFVEHRHDQSILSLLWKDMDFPLAQDLTSPDLFPNSPILATRNNSKLSWQKNSLVRKVSGKINTTNDTLTLIVYNFLEKMKSFFK